MFSPRALLRYFGILTALAIAFIAISPVSPTLEPAEAQSNTGICGRTPQVQIAILAELTGETCDTVTTADLNGITGNFDLGTQNIRSFKSGDTAGLTGITNINIVRNSLSELPDDFWDDLSGLTQLSIYHNDFTSLPSDFFHTSAGVMFAAAPNITYIDAQGSSIETIGANTFDGFTSLATMFLSRNDIKTIEPGAFDGLSSLARLSLHYNELETLPAGLFDKMNATKTACDYTSQTPTNVNITFMRLDIQNNRISSLPAGLFDCLEEFRSLQIEDNKLATFPSGFFDKNTKMTWLSADNNEITSLPSNFFANNAELQVVYLNGNQLTSLQGVGLDKLRGVFELNISDNRLTQLPDDFVTSFLADATSSTRTTDGFCLYSFLMSDNPFSPSWMSSGKLSEVLTYYGTYNPRGTGKCNLGVLWGGNRNRDDNTSNISPQAAEALALSGIDLSTIVTSTSKSVWDTLLDDFTHQDSNNALDRFTLIYHFAFGWDGLNINDAMLDKLPVQLEVIEVKDATFDSDISTATGEGFDRFDSTSGPWVYYRLLPIETATHFVTWSSDKGDGLQNLRLDNVGLSGDGSALLGKLNHDKMRWLEIVNNPGLTGISSHIKSMTKLRGVQIEHNNVSSIGSEAFDGLGELVYLGLGSNAIADVHSDAFDGLSKMEILLLNENDIDALSVGTLTDAVKLENLYLQDNDLAGLPTDLFKGLTAMEQIRLEDNPGAPFHIGVNIVPKPGDAAQRLLSIREGAPYTFWVDVLDSNKAITETIKITSGTSTIPATSSFVLPTNGSIGFMDKHQSWPGNNNRWCFGAEDCFTGFEFRQNPPARLIDAKMTSPEWNYTIGAKITFAARYSEPVTVTGTPTMTFTIGNPQTRVATYVGQPEPHILNFEYTVQTEDGGRSGVSTANSTIGLPSGASIGDTDGNESTGATHSPAKRTYAASVISDRVLISRIEPTIRGVTLQGGEDVRLAIEVYGVQNILDNSLLDNITLVWDDNDAGGSFDGTGEKVVYTAPSVPGSYNVTASLIPNYCKEDPTTDETECSASFEVTVRRPSAPQPEDEAPVNPSGEIPTILIDSDGNQYEVFTPVEGGTFDPDAGYRISAESGDVPNGELVGVRMSDDGPASNLGMTHQRYTLGGNMYGIHVVDSTGTTVSSYLLDDPAEVCIPLPAELRSNISKIAMVAMNSDDSLTILAASVRIGTSGTSVCGNISNLPATVAVGVQGAPDAIPTATPMPEPEAPDTGGRAPSSAGLLWLMLIGIATIAVGVYVRTTRRRRMLN